MVRSPVSVPALPSTAMAVERNCAVGWLSTANQLAERRWSWRLVTPESTEAVSMVTSIVDAVGWSATWTVPSTPLNGLGS
jgi:hypothetical protein